MDDYVSKPLRPADLFDAIFRVCGVAPGELSPQLPAEAPPPTDEPEVFDRAAALDRMEGDQELLDELVAIFLGVVPPRLQELHEALTASEGDTFGRIAHGIKGEASNIGAEAIRAAALALEEMGSAANLTAAPAALTRLRAVFAES